MIIDSINPLVRKRLKVFESLDEIQSEWLTIVHGKIGRVSLLIPISRFNSVDETFLRMHLN